MPVLGGLFNNQWQDGGGDFGVIASRVAEQLANTNAASTSEQQKKITEIAKRPQPVRSVTVTHKPDGTMDQIVTVKNAPQQDPAQEAQAASAGPQADYLQHVVAPIIHGGAATISALPDPESIDPGLLASRQGREQLLKQSGLDAAFGHRPGEGLLGMAARLDKRDELLNDPERLKRLVMAQRFRERAAVGDEVRPFQQDLNAMDTQRRQHEMEVRQGIAEDRRQKTEARREEETFIGDFTRGDHNYGFMDDKGAQTLIDAEKQRYKARFGEDKEMPAWMETMMHSRIMDDRAKNSSDKAKTQFTQDNQDRSYERLMTILGMQQANTQSMIAARDAKANTTRVSRRDAIETPANELLSYLGDDSYDQKSVNRALTTKDNVLGQECNKLTAAIRLDSPTVNTMATSEPWKKSEIAKIIARIKNNQQRIREIDAERAIIARRSATATPAGAPPPPPPSAAPRDPLGILH